MPLVGILAAMLGMGFEVQAEDPPPGVCATPETPGGLRASLLSSLESAGSAEEPARRALVIKAQGQEINVFKGGRNIMEKRTYGMAMPQAGVSRTMTLAPGMQAVETFSEYRLARSGP